MLDSLNDTVKHILDWAAIGAAIATLASWLPPLAAGMSCVWLGMQMYDRHKGKKTKDE